MLKNLTKTVFAVLTVGILGGVVLALGILAAGAGIYTIYQ
jgi:hypothetical protein